MQKIDAKVSPEVAIFVQLDELNGRMSALLNRIESMSARGARFSEAIPVTDTPQRVAFEAISYTLVNDGSGSVYTHDTPNIRTTTDNELKVGESESIDLKRQQSVEFWMRCAAGQTATVRLRRLI